MCTLPGISSASYVVKGNLSNIRFTGAGTPNSFFGCTTLGVAGRGGSVSCSVPTGVAAFTRVCEGMDVVVNVLCIFQADARRLLAKAR